MPALDDITYSREATIAAVRDYYQFLTDMFLPDGFINEPPADGWPSITKEKVALLGKNDEVFELMRHLPYLPDETLLVAHAEIARWPSLVFDAHLYDQRPFDETDVEETRIITEGLDWPDIPSSAFGLTCAGRDDDIFILDTQFGTVHWIGAPFNWNNKPTRQPLTEPSGGSDPFEDCTPENEHSWRSHTAWAIPDFFEILKNEFRTLNSVPVHPRRAEQWYKQYETRENLSEWLTVIRSIRRIYQEHGWPNLSVYRKKECQDAVFKLVDGSVGLW